jgi:hypothetical protein
VEKTMSYSNPCELRERLAKLDRFPVARDQPTARF